MLGKTSEQQGFPTARLPSNKVSEQQSFRATRRQTVIASKQQWAQSPRGVAA
jgi:hypothetical protein